MALWKAVGKCRLTEGVNLSGSSDRGGRASKSVEARFLESRFREYAETHIFI